MKRKLKRKLLIAGIACLSLVLCLICVLGVKMLSEDTASVSSASGDAAAAETKAEKDTATAKPTEEPTSAPTEEPTPEPTEEAEEEEESEDIEEEYQEEETASDSGSSDSSSTAAIAGESSVFYDTDSYLICANKKHKLPDGYVPSDLAYPEVDYINAYQCMRWDAAVALEEMFAAAADDGVTLLLQSGYRSESYQNQLYSYYSSIYGSDTADTISSRPGYSDHQTGLACDIGSSSNPDTNLSQSFINTEEGQWLYYNAQYYGFIMRYPVGKDSITGYAYEPWHYRYIGVDQAIALKSADPDMSFEEYYGVAGGDYAD